MLGDTLIAIKNDQPGRKPEVAPYAVRRTSYRAVLLVVAAFIFIITGVVVGFVVIHHTPSVVPVSILERLNFEPYVVRQQDGLTVDQSTYKYSASEAGMVYTISSSTAGRLTVSEQATPQELSDGSSAFSTLIDSMNRQYEIQTKGSTVYITQGSQTNNQVAVMNANGVLVFVQSTHALSGDQWQALFSSLYQYKLPNPPGYLGN